MARALRMLAAGTVAAPALRAAAAEAETEAVYASGAAGLGPGQWRVIAAVHDHLLPSEPDSPGAKQIHATGYLRLVLANPRVGAGEREIVARGVGELEALCRKLYDVGFVVLGEKRREAALRELESSPSGRRWLGELLAFLMEALLGDPSHGGNPGGIGWEWLRITPGVPRPASRRDQGS